MYNIKAAILNRGKRKFWYVKYQVFNDNDIVKSAEESTKVLKTEKSHVYMCNVYLPAWKDQTLKALTESKKQDTSFAFYAKHFLNECRHLHDLDTMTYRLNRILEDFGEKDILDITKFDIRQWLLSLVDRRTNEPLSKNSQSKYLRLFHGVFQQAEDNNLFDSNFTYDIKLPKGKRDLNKVKPFFSDEVRILLERSKDPSYGKFIHNYLGVAFHQGLSPSEMLGLQTSDIDFTNKIIHIKRDVTKGKVKETKNSYRERSIPLFEVATPYLETLVKQAQKIQTIWLFHADDGSPLYDIQNIRGTHQIIKGNKSIKKLSGWYKLLDGCDIKYRDLKNCRHTFAVSAIESKQFSLQEIADMLGHSSLEMLIKHYAKWIGKKSLQADRAIDIFGDSSGDTTKR